MKPSIRQEHLTDTNENVTSMNIFFAPPDHISDSLIELTGQEAVHASKVLRYEPGDPITVIDGAGGWYEGVISQITKKSVRIEVTGSEFRPRRHPRLVLGLGIIKKRDRLEFAVEKAVELGVSAIALFRGEHTVKQNVRLQRLESVALSAMKQSLRAWLPDIRIYDSLEGIIDDYASFTLLAAHEQVDIGVGINEKMKEQKDLLLLVGPEGGFSESEIDLIQGRNGRLISLGRNRLRTETAAVVFLSQFI